MAIRGPKPKDPSLLRRNSGFAESTEVPNVPYDGPRPDLPKRRTIMQAGQPVRVPMNPMTTGWWGGCQHHAALQAVDAGGLAVRHLGGARR